MKINSYYFTALLIVVCSIILISSAKQDSSANNIKSVNNSLQTDTGTIDLCEQFVSATFPPTGWTLIYTGTLYWSRVAQSGFNNGVGSAKFNMWDAPNGNIQSLISPQFNNTVNGDSLVLDIADCELFGTNDSLILYASTNAGISFIYISDILFIDLTVPPGGCPGPFIPTASEWHKQEYNLPTATNKIKILGKSGFGDNAYIDSICIKSGLSGITHNIYNIPAEYSLAQNYPNPFNPTTIISFGLPKAGDVKLVIFDILGNEVKTLINEFRIAGSYKIEFDGSQLASGVYFYKLEVKDFSETKKMLMLK